jgi:PAS domain-containing protein
MLRPDFRLPTGLRGRLLLAFGAIGALAVVATAAGLVALLIVWRLENTTARRMPETIAVMELSEHTEPLVPIGPALSNTTNAEQFSVLTASKNAELAASLAVATAAGFLSSVLIVWLLSAIAAGRLLIAVDEQANDEIAAMARTVALLRRNAIENALRAKRAVEDRTGQLARDEASLRVMIDNIDQGVAMFDRDLILVSWNRPFCELLRLPDSFLESRPSFDEFFRLLASRGEFGPGGIEKKIADSRSATGRLSIGERTRPDGTTLEVRRNPISSGGFVSVYTDVTERKRAHAQIREAKQDVEAAFRELKATQANLTHAEKMAALAAKLAREIKKPPNFVNILAAVSVELKAASGSAVAVSSAAQREKIEKIIANLERIAQHSKQADDIANRVLAYSRANSGERQ